MIGFFKMDLRNARYLGKKDCHLFSICQDRIASYNLLHLSTITIIKQVFSILFLTGYGLIPFAVFVICSVWLIQNVHHTMFVINWRMEMAKFFGLLWGLANFFPAGSLIIKPLPNFRKSTAEGIWIHIFSGKAFFDV